MLNGDVLDRYLKQQAGQDAESGAALPFVLASTDVRIAGYYTLSSYGIRSDDIPSELIKRLRLPRYNVTGATLLGRLARDLSFKGQGIGEILLPAVSAGKKCKVLSKPGLSGC